MKKFYRIPGDKVIAGVCAGIGDQYDIDANIIRVGLVFVCVATAIMPVVAAYIAAWFLLPEVDERERREIKEKK